MRLEFWGEQKKGEKGVWPGKQSPQEVPPQQGPLPGKGITPEPVLWALELSLRAARDGGGEHEAEGNFGNQLQVILAEGMGFPGERVR